MEMTNDNLTLDTWQQYNCIPLHNTTDVHYWVPISWKARRNSSIHVYDWIIHSMVLIRRHSINFDLGRAAMIRPPSCNVDFRDTYAHSNEYDTLARARRPRDASSSIQRRTPWPRRCNRTFLSLETRHRNYHRLPVKADKPLSLSRRTDMKRRCDEWSNGKATDNKDELII